MNTALSFSPEITSQLRSKGLEVRELSEEKLPRVVEMEEASYSGDEAATPEKLRFRQKFARSFFLEASLDGSKVGDSKIVAFICGTCCQGSELTHDSMSGHDPEGTSLCIHSVVVDEKFRRRGYVTLLMKAYLERIAVTQPRLKRVCLITKAGLLGMYASFGFSIKGLSPVVHGKDPWFEMSIDLDNAEPRLLRFLQVDAFTKRAFCGNPAAVFFTHAGGDKYWMQKVAIEMNLSETCFLQLQTNPKETGDQPQGTDPTYALRWFTPGGEVSLCGHATLAAAHSLWEEGRVDPNIPIRFSTASGILTCRRDPGDGWISMDFPSEEVGKPLEAQDESRKAVVEALRLGDDDVLFVGRNRYDMMIEVTPEALAVMEPDMRLLNAIESRGFIVTCVNQVEGVDFKSRFFAPKCGINEDPVTGSAHCCLGPYWSSKLGRDTLVGYQASPRGGTVSVTVGQGDEGNRVTLKGEAVTVFRGLFRR